MLLGGFEELKSPVLAPQTLVMSFLSHGLLFCFHLINGLAMFCNGHHILTGKRPVPVRSRVVLPLRLVRCKGIHCVCFFQCESVCGGGEVTLPSPAFPVLTWLLSAAVRCSHGSSSPLAPCFTLDDGKVSARAEDSGTFSHWKRH